MQLYNHQKIIVDEDKKKTGLFLGTGSGKTRIALLLSIGKTLIICPKTQKLDQNWEREYIKLGHCIDPYMILNVISKEEFRRDWDKLPKYDTVIVDEVHTMAGVTPNLKWVNKRPVPKTSQLFEALLNYLTKTRPGRFYALTATPIRSPMCVWGIAKFLGHHWSWREFRDRFYVELPMPGRVKIFAPKKDLECKEHLGRIIRHLGYVGKISDYVDMPDQVFKTEYVEIKEDQKKRLKTIGLDFPDPLVRNMKRHQIENGVLTGDEFNPPEEYPNGKIDKILDYAGEFLRLVIFARYTMQIEQIEKALIKAGKTVLTLTGKTKDRKKLFETANNLEECIVVAQTQISAGWELPDFGVMIFASIDHQIVNLIQAQGRISRITNPKRNLYIYLVTKGYKMIIKKNNKEKLVMRESVDKGAHDSVVINKMDFHMKMYE